MLLPNCLLLSTLIYKKQHVFATDSNVSPVIKPKLIFFLSDKAWRGGGAVRHLTMPSLSDLSLNLALRAYLRADFKAKMAKIGNLEKKSKKFPGQWVLFNFVILTP